MKGKYAARAARRREDQSVQSEIAAYQHHVKRLTDENRELAGKLASEQEARKRETRQLRAERDEGLSPEVRALRAELERQRQRADAAMRGTRKVLDNWRRASKRIVDLFKALGLTPVEACEVMMWLAGSDDGTLVEPAWENELHGLTQQQAAQLQAVRRRRHQRDILAIIARRTGYEAAGDRW